MERHPMGDYKHGTMDIRTHEKTFEGFVRLVTWTAGIVVVLLVFVALVNG